MTKYLGANWVTWKKDSQQGRTIFRNANTSLDFTISVLGPQTNPPFNQIRNLTQMPVDGAFVGIIVHVRNSNANGDTEFVCVKGTEAPGSSINNIEPNATFIETPVKVIVPAGEIGFFFSDPDIAEFSREFLRNEFIGIKTKKIGGGQSRGLFAQTTVSMALEIKTPSVQP